MCEFTQTTQRVSPGSPLTWRWPENTGQEGDSESLIHHFCNTHISITEMWLHMVHSHEGFWNWWDQSDYSRWRNHDATRRHTSGVRFVWYGSSAWTFILKTLRLSQSEQRYHGKDSFMFQKWIKASCGKIIVWVWFFFSLSTLSYLSVENNFLKLWGKVVNKFVTCVLFHIDLPINVKCNV